MTTNTQSAKHLERNEMILALINNDMNLYESEGGYQYCMELLRDGFKGYENFTTAELLYDCISAELPGY